jgi:guanosine-3',5'-bis(diphosphate) 3'-pyrophosphohydrolase
LAQYEDNTDLWIDLHWQDGKHPAAYDVTLELTISNDAGVLGRVCSMIGDTGSNISDLVFVDRKPDFFKIEISIDLSDIEHLHSVLSRLEAETEVAMTKRLRRSELAKTVH